uniref:SAP30-binding protein n=1 Tax=Ascaris lumbricoides TaxID=6252 RepID=A0A9J2P6F0_ASCLU
MTVNPITSESVQSGNSEKVMNQLVAYESEEDSPDRRRSREDPYKNASDHGELSTGELSARTARKVRKNSERWTASDGEREGPSRESTSDSSHSDSGSSSAGEQPPPPKRQSPYHSERSVQSEFGSISLKQSQSVNVMPINQSQTSLVSYGAQEDEEEDQFTRADKKAAAESRSMHSPPRSRSVTVEPKPPRGHQDSRSPDEIAVDSALEEGLRELREHATQGGDSSAESPNPASVDGHESPLNVEVLTEVTLPPSPTEKCSRELELRFEKFFAKKAAGIDLNSSIQKRRDFKNPSIYERLIETFEVDELGSNFHPSVFDPHGFSEDCFYDAISTMQKEVMEKYTANAEKKGASTSADAASKGNDAKRKSRFEGTKKH